MATNFPTSLDSLTNPASGDSLSSPSHAGQHADANDAIEALEAKVGVNGSAVTTSLDYKVTNGILSGLNVDSGVLYVDATNNRVGVNKTSPSHALDVIGRIEARAATVQDGVALLGRAGGASSFDVALTPTTLTADRTLTLPDTTGDLVAFTSARGSNTAWTGYTTTITQLGNVTFAAYVSRYCQMGKTIHWEFALLVSGTGTINNAIRINLPQTAQGNAIYSNYGTMHVYDASANTHYCGHAFAYSTTQAAMMLNAGTTYFQTIALASNDIISGHIIYEAA